MKKIIKLTEGDLSRIVKRVIKEEQEDTMARKVENVIHLPKVEERIENIYNHLTDADKEKLKMALKNLGVTENSTAKQVHAKIEKKIEEKMVNKLDNLGREMSEEDEHENPKHTAAKMLHTIGAANISAWGGVPAAIAIGGLLAGTVGAPMVAGFAISWGTTALLMGLAKLLAGDEKVEGVNENYRRRQYRRRY